MFCMVKGRCNSISSTQTRRRGRRRNLRRPPPSLLRFGILKSHGNGQSGGSFGRSVRCGFVVSVALHEFGYSPSPLKIDATYEKTEKN